MLLDQIQKDLAVAQKTRDQIKVDCLRFLLGAVFDLQIEKYPPSKGGSLVDADVLSVISKQVKTHKESIEMFEKAGRKDLVDREKSELAILQSYLPEQISDEEVRSKIKDLKSQNPQADFPTLIKLAMGELKGKADGGLVAKLVKEILGT